MAILIANKGDKVVATINDRDNLVDKFPNMEVTVTDAIGDIEVGPGSAGYKWIVELNKWILTWKTTKDDMEIFTEDLVITNGEVTLSYAPQSNIVWGALIYDSNETVLGEVKSPQVSGTYLNVGSQSYNGLTLSVTYAYGKINAAIAGLVNSWKVINSNYNSQAKDRLFVDTSSAAIVVELPSGPVLGDTIQISDYASNFATSPLYIAPSTGTTEKLLGSRDILVVNITNKFVSLVYSGSDKGWVFGA